MNKRKLLNLKKKKILNRRARKRLVAEPKKEIIKEPVGDLTKKEIIKEPVGDLTIKYFYINLGISRGRRLDMEKQFEEKNMNVTRFEAINGNKVYKGHKHAGSKACRDTHLKLWRQINSNEIYIIFEDDITIVEDKFSDYVKELTSKDPNWTFLNFKNMPKRFKGTRISDKFGKAAKVGTFFLGGTGVNAGLWAYAVNGRTIRSLLNVFKGGGNIWAIDYQLRNNFDKVNGYFCLGDEHLATHGDRETMKSVRLGIDKKRGK
tara:strand:- start:8 stop:793 length:786 start_codon:yes stop_codon:yes gene_type:complete